MTFGKSEKTYTPRAHNKRNDTQMQSERRTIDGETAQKGDEGLLAYLEHAHPRLRLQSTCTPRICSTNACLEKEEMKKKGKKN